MTQSRKTQCYSVIWKDVNLLKCIYNVHTKNSLYYPCMRLIIKVITFYYFYNREKIIIYTYTHINITYLKNSLLS